MDQKTMEQIIKAKASSHQGENGVVDKTQIESAMDQVANLALTFGTKYSGGTLVFGGGKAKQDAETKKGKSNE